MCVVRGQCAVYLCAVQHRWLSELLLPGAVFMAARPGGIVNCSLRAQIVGDAASVAFAQTSTSLLQRQFPPQPLLAILFRNRKLEGIVALAARQAIVLGQAAVADNDIADQEIHDAVKQGRADQDDPRRPGPVQALQYEER